MGNQEGMLDVRCSREQTVRLILFYHTTRRVLGRAAEIVALPAFEKRYRALEIAIVHPADGNVAVG